MVVAFLVFDFTTVRALGQIFSVLKVRKSHLRLIETRRPIIHLHINHQRYRLSISIDRRSLGSHDCRLSLDVTQQTNRFEKEGARCPTNEGSSIILSPGLLGGFRGWFVPLETVRDMVHINIQANAYISDPNHH